jgi:hypothetical protein
MARFLLLTFLAFVFFGCSSKNISPATISKDFWKAQKQNDIEYAKKLTVKESTSKTTLYKKIKIKAVDFSEVKEDENRATIATKLYLKGDKDIDEVEFLTVLDKTDKGWRVNMSSTKRNLYLEIGKQVTGDFGSMFENFKDVFENLIKDFQDIVEKP